MVRDEVDPVLMEWLESLPTVNRFFGVDVGESRNLGGGEESGCFLEGESSHRLSSIIGLTAFRFVTMNSGWVGALSVTSWNSGSLRDDELDP